MENPQEPTAPVAEADPDWVHELSKPILTDAGSRITRIGLRRSTLGDLVRAEEEAPPEERDPLILGANEGARINPAGHGVFFQVLTDPNVRAVADRLDVVDWMDIESKLTQWAKPTPAVRAGKGQESNIERVQVSPDGARTVDLAEPFLVADELIDAVKMRRPQLGDIRRPTAQTPDTQRAHLAAKLCGRDPVELYRMALSDWMLVREVVNGFFVRSGDSTS